MSEELGEIFELADDAMAKAMESYLKDLSRLRTGRANLKVLDGVRVEYYGSSTPLNQVAALNVADARMITVKPWDKGMLTAIEKAIVSSNLGLTPGNDGELIRLPIPPLTGERRQDLVRQLGRLTEDARVKVRGARRDANGLIKDANGVSEDEMHRALKQMQEQTDQAIVKLDSEATSKESEIMEF
jgi:ribosome recycling factor